MNSRYQLGSWLLNLVNWQIGWIDTFARKLLNPSTSADVGYASSRLEAGHWAVRYPEKRKVDSSIMSLTQSLEPSELGICIAVRFASSRSGDCDVPFVTAFSCSMLHVGCTAPD
jgi:hypothetical protein